MNSMNIYNNSLYIAGFTDSESLYISNDAFQGNYSGNTDGFIFIIDILSYLSSVNPDQIDSTGLILTIVIPISLIAVTVTIFLIRKYRRNV